MKKITEQQVLRARTPESYINLCLLYNGKGRTKQQITQAWLNKTGHTIDDIKYARHRHPYWKAMKLKGHKERNARRMREFAFLKSTSRHAWEDYEIAQFLSLNKKDREGNYIYKDTYIASKMRTSIPSVQYWRRKINLIEKILSIRRGVYPKNELITKNENFLRTLYQQTKGKK